MFFFLTPFLFSALWLVGLYGKGCCIFTAIGSAFGVAGYVFFSFSLALSSRWKKLEDWIFGLDQIYHLHRRLGIWGFCLILIHPLIIGLHWLPAFPDKFFLLTLPIHGRLSVNLGVWAFWIMILILGITLLKLLSYDKWKVLHKFMSLVFLLSALHIFLSSHRLGSEFSQALLWIPTVIGFLGIFYKQIYFPLFGNTILFQVASIKKLNDNCIEVEVIPEARKLKFTPGQYGFFSFRCNSLSRESHPFTLIKYGKDSTITLLVKARGDFTRSLYRNIEAGCFARFEGPYGRFNYEKAGSTHQVWIAGGVGVVPFLAWIRAMSSEDLSTYVIDFYYCVHRKVDAIYYDEFQQLSQSYPNFRCYLHCTKENNRLDADKIKSASGKLDEKKFLMCGPLKLTRDFTDQLQALGVKRANILFEDFEFF